MVGVRSRAFLNEAPQDPTFKFLSGLAKELSSGRVELPSFPDAAARVQQVLSDPAVDGDRIARVIGADAGLAARLMTMANSALLHRGDTAVTDLKIAVTRIGHDNIRAAALAYANSQVQRAPELAHIRPQLEACWREGIRVASLAHSLAKETGAVRTDEAMLAGLLHNVGKLYIHARAPRSADAAAALDASVINAWYPSIGKALAQNWKLPEEICAAIESQLESDRVHEGAADLPDILIVAVQVAARMAARAPDDEGLAKLPAAITLGLAAPAFKRIALDAHAELQKLQAALG
ncbi:MAG TPA: HDOD domain-containing protein [Steroidobacteraceae bacterium]|nr:HDOD domain-containing protein [Steroidobacteraceae bacterium]